NINIPANAALGYTRIRIRLWRPYPFTNTDACSMGYGLGETEDYRVNIIACEQGIVNRQPVNSSAMCGHDATFTAVVTGSLLAYQWEERTNPTAQWTNVTNGNILRGATTNTL